MLKWPMHRQLQTLPTYVIKLMWPTVMLKGKCYHSKVPTATTLRKLQRLWVYCGSPTKSTNKHQYWQPQCHDFFSPSLYILLLFPFFFPPLLFLTPSVSLSFCLNTPLIEKRDPCKRCTEAGSWHCYTNNMEKRWTQEVGISFHKWRQFSQYNSNL